MSSLLNFKGTPNLLELVEAYGVRAGTVGDLSVCDDDRTPTCLSVCGDEVQGFPSGLIGLSLCADEANDTDLTGPRELQSVCADEGPAGHSV